jgi:glycosyltransferase involved in cell wall biosynthesis
LNVLLLTQVLPYPPDSGPKIKTYNVIKYLAQHHRVTLVSFVRGDQSEYVRHLEQYCEAVYTMPMERGIAWDGRAMVRSLLTRQPWMMVRDDRRAMRHLVERLAEEHSFDVAHADQLNMAQYAEGVPGAFKVLDTHNALWLLYRRLSSTMSPGPRKLLLGRDWRLLKRYEGRMVREFDAVLAVSHEDEAALQEAAGQLVDIVVIPIAIDTDQVTPIERAAEAGHILHIGTMYWPPNIDGVLWFIHQVYPHIRARRPDVVFDVVGVRPPQEIVDLGGEGTGVNVTGYVEDLTPYLEHAGVMVVRAGGGIRVKILNGLAQALPIVSTSLGCEGIAVEAGRHLLIADTPEEFAQATLRLLNDRDLAGELGRNGRRLIQSRYDYRVACRPLEDVYWAGAALTGDIDGRQDD